MSILEKLSAKLRHKKSQQSASWSAFVTSVADGKTSDPDEILAALERLNRSPEDLQDAIDLLIKRRELSKVVQSGDAAEAELPAARDAITAEEKRYAELHAKHELKMDAMLTHRNGLVQKITRRDDAARELLSSVPTATSEAVYGPIDQKIVEVNDERASVRQAIKNLEQWLFNVDEQGDSASTGDIQRLADQRQRLRDLKRSEGDLANKLSSLQDERNAASKRLLLPELI